MAEYRYVVTVYADASEQAAQVMTERLGCDEWYGFDYTIDYEPMFTDGAIKAEADLDSTERT